MNKRVLLIGNTNNLPGVKIDLANYIKFFKSQYGGDWRDFEIEAKVNPSKTELLIALSRLKALSLDYAIVIFSGHGGQERETILEINANGDTISESSLKNLANRQITIFDCCRSFSQPIIEEKLRARTVKYFSASFSTRVRFEKRIMEAIHQQVSLYACAIGECSNDTSSGGVYSKHFIDAAYTLSSDYKLVGAAHEEAAIMTKSEVKNQSPEAILPRCLSTQQLIISINP